MAIDATQKLSIYNRALGAMGERKLASLTEAREPRYVLDDFFSDVVGQCLEFGDWKFARRFLKIDASTSVEPDFGFQFAFPIPTDFLKSRRIAEDENLDIPLIRFREENGFWYANVTPIYLEYVSSSATLGGLDGGRWPQLFEQYVAARLATLSAPRVTGWNANIIQYLEGKEKKAKADAMELNAIGTPPQAQMRGSWVMSRMSGSNRSRWDRRS